MPTLNKRASIPVNMVYSILTNSRIEVGDNCSECDDYQLDSLLPFGPLKSYKVNITVVSDTLEAQTDVLRVFWVIAWLRPEDNFTVW